MKEYDNFLWVERYRPQSLNECILPESMKESFMAFIDKGSVPNLLLSGGAGTGKTTAAKALCNDLGIETLVINASLERNIDMLRERIVGFASSVSMFSTGRKIVILDEADYLNKESSQPALRGMIEEFSKNCGFIFTCNYKNKIIDPLQSRLVPVEFVISKSDKPRMMAKFMKRLRDILENEKVEYDGKVIAELINKLYPDYRKILNAVQMYSASGKIDSGILASLSSSIDDLIPTLKAKDFRAMREWVATNADADPVNVFRKIYDGLYEYVEPEFIPGVVITLSTYQYQNAFVVDKEINLVACLTEIMAETEFR